MSSPPCHPKNRPNRQKTSHRPNINAAASSAANTDHAETAIFRRSDTRRTFRQPPRFQARYRIFSRRNP
ncbi:hypothetical protein [Neisseria cinerea]|uniref:hypothetical protein n=1 Tax=Neisseria cinerea TaxID=483 RepID=UPI0002ECDA70|nr:hypothetical protein [Neisseria cinerea]MCD2070155.1 hypothetical protein [Neisseria cinerea]